MIPLRDVIPSRTTPYVTVSLVVINVLVFLYQFTLGKDVNEFVFTYGLVPAYFSWVSVVTSMCSQECGLLNSILVTTPSSWIGRLMSNSAANE